MPPSFLIIGATGNTGVGVVHTLSALLEKANSKYSSYDIIALTRTASSKTAQDLAKLPKVKIIETDWVYIDSDWLREHKVERLFIASHNKASHFTDESLVLNYAREAKVEYVVRISTANSNVTPDTSVFYARNHWAVENLLSQPEFDSLKWSSLRPTIFASMIASSLQAWLKNYRETGKQIPLTYLLDADAPVAIIDPYEIGVAAAHLLACEDISPHASKKYIVAGPQDASGKDVVQILEKYAKTKIEDVRYRDTSYSISMKGTGVYDDHLLPSLGRTFMSSWEGGWSNKVAPTSPELAKLYAPKNGVLDVIDAALGAV